MGNYQQIIFSDYTLPYFVDSLPSSLRHLYFNFNIYSEPLKFILKELKIPLKSIEFHQTNLKDDEAFNAILDYQKSNQEVCEEINLFVKRPYLKPETKEYDINIILDASEVSKNYDLW